MKKKTQPTVEGTLKPRNPFGSLSSIMKKGGSHEKPEKAKRAREKIETKKVAGGYTSDFEGP